MGSTMASSQQHRHYHILNKSSFPNTSKARILIHKCRNVWRGIPMQIKFVIHVTIYTVILSLLLLTVAGHYPSTTTLFPFLPRDFNEVYSPQYIWKFGLMMLSDKHDQPHYILPARQSDHIYELSQFEHVRDGDIIWIRELQLFDFVQLVLPQIDAYFTLIIATNLAHVTPLNYDESLIDQNANGRAAINGMDAFHRLLSSKYLLFLFTENYDESLRGRYQHIEGIPIGFDFHTSFTRPSAGRGLFGHSDLASVQELRIKRLLNSDDVPYLSDRKMAIYLDFALNVIASHGDQKYREWLHLWNAEFGKEWKPSTDSNHEEFIQKFYGKWRSDKFKKQWFRSWILSNIQQMAADRKRLFFVDDKGYDFYDGLIRRSQFVFALSPFGNGLDCHRTYESLLMGNIVIMHSSPLDALWERHNLPIVSIHDLREINATMLHLWYQKYRSKTTLESAETRYKLTSSYWMSYVRQQTLQRLDQVRKLQTVES